jgi:uncharacterized RDD family membrane protein YckC
MACPVCGKPSPCAHEQKRAATGVDAGLCEGQQSLAQAVDRSPARSGAPAAANDARERVTTEPWRHEIVSRVRQHRARRHKRFHSNATMELDFQTEMNASQADVAENVIIAPRAPVRQEPPKIIEFPRPVTNVYFPPEPVRELEEDQLAEPVLETPRILDAPEPPPVQMDLLSAFADIELKADERGANHDVELPPQVAPLFHRAVAGVIDMALVLAGAALFAVGFVMFASGLPQLRFVVLCALLVSGSFWLMYQYLFLVYSTCTPGMQFAQLELCTFNSGPVSLSLRRWRALASVLSAFALGLGYVWAFVDEDRLGWHDRMTQTHLRQQSATLS